ncbi:stalk domain-containing protein [Caldalkalibacillus mannanilyticus]|uniref:stalk domain-containing protein n=1 Tax=Caldalkalibacillus mannanilyticus TaxID=1418 RepID=UPI000469B664|nr:stalk domain-containing protein [Caldalkalibacillus mannanilyticus]
MRKLSTSLFILVLALSFILSSTTVGATSKGLDLNGDWRAITVDNTFVELTLQQKGSDVTGTYYATYRNDTYAIPVKGKVSGSKANLYLVYDTPELVKASGVSNLPDRIVKQIVGIRSLLAFDFGVSEDEAQGEFLGWYIEWSGSSVKKYEGGSDYARKNNPPTKLTLTRIFEMAHVVLDGDYLVFDQPAIIKNNSTMVPLRAIFEELGATIEWNAAEKTVVAVKDDRHISLKIGDSTAMINGEKIQLSTPAQIIGGRTLVPLRFVSEALGAKVSWDGATKTVYIASE